MNAKLFKISAVVIAATLLWSLPAVANPWEGSTTGKCYDTLNDYLETSLGASYKEDNNVKILEASGYGPQYKWVIDLTPGTNVTRVLISVRENNSACVILVAPFASSIKVEPSKTGIPKKIITTDTPAPGYPTTEILYSLNNNGVYEPSKCSEIRRNKKKTINCEKAFAG